MSGLTLSGITLRYGATTALHDVTIAVEPATRLAIVGPSGSGKSTLLRVLAGFEAPDAGQVRLDGRLITDGRAILPAHRRHIGLVAQEGALFPHLTVAENIGFGLPRRDPARAATVAEMAALNGLDAAMLARHPDALSGGQQQRVALARALACRPRLMLLDEPFSALDTALRAETRHAVAALLARARITTVLVTHDQEEALSFADQLAVLHAGRLLQAGAPRDLYLHPADETVAHFLGEAIVLDATLDAGQADTPLGPIPVATTRTGPARLMLRPEQLRLVPGGPATVAEATFAGATCALTLVLPGATIRLKAPQNTAPPLGTGVTIEVTGQAHVFT